MVLESHKMASVFGDTERVVRMADGQSDSEKGEGEKNAPPYGVEVY